MDKGLFKLSLRVLRRRRFFTFISLFGIAFTLTVLTLVAALYQQVVGDGAPEVNLSRTLIIDRIDLDADKRNFSGNPGYAFLDRYCRDLPGVVDLTAYTTSFEVVSFLAGVKHVSTVRRTDAAYWNVMQFDVVAGRVLAAQDVDGAAPVAVINETTRERIFGDGKAVGGLLQLGERKFRVVGVVRDVDMTRQGAVADVWTPLTTAPTEDWRTDLRGGFEGMLVARSRDDFPAIRRELDARLAAVTPGEIDGGYDTISCIPVTRTLQLAQGFLGQDGARTGPGRFYLLLAGAAALFMLLPAMNLVNMNVSRISERAAEIGVRKAFGASGRDLVAQFVAENVVLCLIGGALGFVGAAGVIVWLNAAQVVPRAGFTMQPVVFVVGLFLALLFGVISGVYPAWRMSRLHPVQALKGESL